MEQHKTPPPDISPEVKAFITSFRSLGRAFTVALAGIGVALNDSNAASARLRGMVERNSRPRLTVCRRDLRAVLAELDMHRARFDAEAARHES